MKIPRNPFSEEPEELRASHTYLFLAVICLFLVILLRLWYLQIIRGSEFRILSESNRTRVQDILPPRGQVLDRNGELLVDNRPAYELAVVREDVADVDALTGRLTYLLGRPWEEIRANLESAKMQPAFKPAVILTGLNREELAAVETFRYELPGVVVQVKPQRKYLHELLASHVIGYLGEINQDELGQERYRHNRMGDLIGRYGIEQAWETELHGRRGWRVVEVDASGRVLKVIRQTNSSPGNNLILTLDARLQQAAQDALGNTAGAVVALDPRNGEILAMASSPTFSQNDFVLGIDQDTWNKLVDDPLHPLENRAISGQYPPGSTFKIISAVAALEEGVVTPQTIINCTGGYQFGDRVFHCWKKWGHGPVDMHRALVESCDVYFYEVGRRLGVDRLAKYSQAFGLGSQTGVGLINEKPGLVPTSEWKKKRFGVSWQQGETLSVIIGQGFNLATPLQMAQAVAVAANGGTVYRPHLAKALSDLDGGVVRTIEPEVIRQLHLKPETVKVIREGLSGVVNEAHGTGKVAKVEGVTVGGKTGTAQVVGRKVQEDAEGEIPYQYRDHAWFVAFAPVDNPEIAVAVVAEHAGHGGSAAAPIAQRVMDAYFHPDSPKRMDALLGPEDLTDIGD